MRVSRLQAKYQQHHLMQSKQWSGDCQVCQTCSASPAYHKQLCAVRYVLYTLHIEMPKVWGCFKHPLVYGLAILHAYAHTVTQVCISLVPRPLRDFISQPWIKICLIFLYSCEMRSGSGLEPKLGMCKVCTSFHNEPFLFVWPENSNATCSMANPSYIYM